MPSRSPRDFAAETMEEALNKAKDAKVDFIRAGEALELAWAAMQEADAAFAKAETVLKSADKWVDVVKDARRKAVQHEAAWKAWLAEENDVSTPAKARARAARIAAAWAELDEERKRRQ
jgi:hypothetical protein